MTGTAELLKSLEAITHETTRMLGALDTSEPGANRRDVKARVLEIRDLAQSLFDHLTAVRPEDAKSREYR
jgi:hypothetical protein